ncbi:MAG: glycosyltransferase family 2 protein [Planctomycetota bacterium]|nr:MAG: glycosyltransferase family 2 protein [Planctomycetota bacterium]
MAPPRFLQSITVVLPAYQEEAGIAQAVTQCIDYLAGAFDDWELLVVDDGSTDGTAGVVEELVAQEPRVRLIRLGTNQGYGRALATGFDQSRGELIFFTDADCQFDIRELSNLVPLMAGADCVFGFRVYRYDSVLRCLLSWTYNRMVRVLFGMPVRDVDCSFKLFSRPVVDVLTLKSTDFFVDTEMVARVARMGARIVEKGVRHYPRTAGHTSVRPSHIPKTLWTLARMWFHIRLGRAAGKIRLNRTPAGPRPIPEGPGGPA